MKKRNFFIPSEDAGAEFKDKLDGKPEKASAASAGGGSPAAPKKGTYDWLMHHDVSPSEEVPYIERLIDGGGPIKHKPITTEPDLRTAVLMIPFSAPNTGVNFKVSYSDPTTGISDVIEWAMIEGDYAAIRETFSNDMIVAEVPGESFSAKNADGTMVSFLNTNAAGQVVRALYNEPSTFDVFFVSTLVRSL